MMPFPGHPTLIPLPPPQVNLQQPTPPAQIIKTTILPIHPKSPGPSPLTSPSSSPSPSQLSYSPKPFSVPLPLPNGKKSPAQQVEFINPFAKFGKHSREDPMDVFSKSASPPKVMKIDLMKIDPVIKTTIPVKPGIIPSKFELSVKTERLTDRLNENRPSEDSSNEDRPSEDYPLEDRTSALTAEILSNFQYQFSQTRTTTSQFPSGNQVRSQQLMPPFANTFCPSPAFSRIVPVQSGKHIERKSEKEKSMAKSNHSRT